MNVGCVKAEFDVQQNVAEPLAEALSDQGLVVRMLPAAGNRWQLVVYDDGEAPNALRNLVTEQATGLGLRDLALEIVWLPAIDWLAENRSSFAALRIGRFYIHDSEHRDAVPANCWPLCIDAATAFGTGGHETTRACIEAIDRRSRLGRRHRPRKVLDMGCGSGILAIAAALGMRCQVSARDVDPEAVRVSRKNCSVNGVADMIDVAQTPPLPRMSESYDLILANILADPLVRLAPVLSRALAPQGRVVLAGMLETQGQAVLRAYLDRRLCLESRVVQNGWLTLVLRRW